MKFYLVLWITIWVLVAFALMGLFSNAYGDYYRTMGVYHKYNPEICIMMPNPEVESRQQMIREMTYSAINEWEWKLVNATGGDWNMNKYEYQWSVHKNKTIDDFPGCTIFITYPLLTEGSSVGRTGFDFSKSDRYYFWIEVDTTDDQNRTGLMIGDSYKNSNWFNLTDIEFLDPIDIRNIVLHEFGHGLGIEHYYLGDCRNEECDTSSIMYGSIDVLQAKPKFVTQQDINMVLRIYGEDGFRKPAWMPRTCEIIDGQLC